MFCCNDCEIETQTTTTTVLIIDNKDQHKQKIKQWASNRTSSKAQQTSIMNHNYKYQQLLHLSKQNQPTLNVQSDIKTKRQIKNMVDSCIVEQERILFETGKFNQKGARGDWMDNSKTKRHLDSKTASFGSLGSRQSSSGFYKERQMQIMQKQLKQLKQQELKLRRDKLQKEYLYKKQMHKINCLRDNLTIKSQQRYSDLKDLKTLLTNRKQTNSTIF